MKMLQEFKEHFPNKCIICGFQRYGYYEGHTNTPIPPEHYCIEKNHDSQ